MGGQAQCCRDASIAANCTTSVPFRRAVAVGRGKADGVKHLKGAGCRERESNPQDLAAEGF